MTAFAGDETVIKTATMSDNAPTDLSIFTFEPLVENYFAPAKRFKNVTNRSHIFECGKTFYKDFLR